MSANTVEENRLSAEGRISATAPAAGCDPEATRSTLESSQDRRDDRADAVASPQRLAANRANAARSTGPRTPAGKERVARNAVQHGLQGRFHLIAGEDPGEYQAFHDPLHRQLDPGGAMEDVLAERVIGAFWRLRRIGRMETEMIDKVLEDALRAKKGNPYASKMNPVDRIFGSELASPEHDVNRISLGEAVSRQIQRSDVIGQLHRYEAHIERGLFRSLHELQRMQAARQGEAVPPPMALDITTDLVAQK